MTDHRVLLINPPRIKGVSWTREGRCQEKEGILGTVKPPFSLALSAAMLRENKIAFKLIDATALNINSDEIRDRLIGAGFRPDIIIYCTTTATISADTEALSAVKNRFNARLIAFGAHLSGAAKETLEKLADLDAGITGEPEYTILDILKQADLSDLSGVRGIAWRNGKEIRLNDSREWIEDLGRLPEPAWDLLPLENYLLPFTDEKYLLVETSRGCPFACDFCVVPLIHGLKFRGKGPEAVVGEIEGLKAKFGITFFNLFGDTATFNKEFMNSFCDEVIRRNIKIQWFTNTRADTLCDINLVNKMKRSGCWMLSLGIESGSEETREHMQKKLETEKIEYALRLLREAGILSFGFFIYGYPGETEQAMHETTKFALSCPLDYANFYPAVPYPGTNFHATCVKEGLLASDSWDEMEYSRYILKTKDLDEAVVKKAISGAYLRFYLRPQFILRHMKNIGPINFFAGSVKYGLKFLSANLKTAWSPGR